MKHSDLMLQVTCHFSFSQSVSFISSYTTLIWNLLMTSIPRFESKLLKELVICFGHFCQAFDNARFLEASPDITVSFVYVIARTWLTCGAHTETLWTISMLGILMH